VYDQLDSHYDVIKSDSIELNEANFDTLVGSTADPLWVVQVGLSFRPS